MRYFFFDESGEIHAQHVERWGLTINVGCGCFSV
jgi:hypothetical protein